jgi:hypothetical protein
MVAISSLAWMCAPHVNTAVAASKLTHGDFSHFSAPVEVGASASVGLARKECLAMNRGCYGHWTA